MKRDTDPGSILNDGVEAMRNHSATVEQVEESAVRVLYNLQSEHAKVVPHPASVEGADRIRGCDDFRALIPAYLSSSLTPSRKLLFEDHTHECVLCRKALEGHRGQTPRPPVKGHRGLPPMPLRPRWIAAAAVAAGIALAFQTTL